MRNRRKKNQKNQKSQRNQEKQGIELEDLCKKATVVIGFVSAICFLICKFISMGRIDYFAFDMKYYEYSLNYISRGIFFIYFGFILVGVILSIVMIAIGAHLEKKYGDKVKNFELFYYFVTIFIAGGIVFALTISILSYGGLNMEMGLFNAELFALIYSMISIFNIDKVNRHNCDWLVCVIMLTLISVGIFSLKKSEYSNAKEQVNFEIIKEKIDIEGKPYQYVVISSSSERYSAYLCELIKENDGMELKIIKNVHKYFPCNGTETVELKFSKILYDELSYEEIGIANQGN